MAAVMRRLVQVELPLPMRVVATRNAGTLRELMPQYWEGPGTRPHAAAYLSEHAAFMAIRTDVPRRQRSTLLLHEYVHLLTAATLPNAPGWLDEGLSEFWGALVFDGDRIIVGRPPTAHVSALKTRRWVPLSELLKQDRVSLARGRGDVTMFYAQSWALVHYLLMGGSESQPLRFAPVYEEATPEMESSLRAYVSASRFPEVAVTVREPLGAPPPSTAVTSSRALAERALMVVLGERKDAAQPMARRAVTMDAREPLAHEVMGTYYFLSNQPDEARRWLTQAFDLDQSSDRVALYLALLSTTAADRERYLMAAVRANPAMTVAWQRLGAIYAEDGRLDAMRRWCRLLLQGPLAPLLAKHLDRCQS
jgi:tetratricopeptide (TPR) repeat protein